jgi:hypothetical protein
MSVGHMCNTLFHGIVHLKCFLFNRCIYKERDYATIFLNFLLLGLIFIKIIVPPMTV